MPEKSDGPCRKVARSRKRSASSQIPTNEECRQSKVHRSTANSHQPIGEELRQGKEILMNGEYSNKTNSSSYVAMNDKMEKSTLVQIENKTDPWFTNSFMNEKYHRQSTSERKVDGLLKREQNDPKTSHTDNLENGKSCCSGDVKKRGRLDLQLSASPTPCEVLLTQTQTDTIDKATSVYFHGNKRLSPLKNTTGDKDSFCHSTPNRGQSTTDDSAFMSCDDCFNNSDILLADIDINIEERIGSHNAPTRTKDVKSHPPEKGHNSTVGKADNSIKLPSIKSSIKNAAVDTESASNKSVIKMHNNEKENCNASDILFEGDCQDGDFLSQIESLEKEMNDEHLGKSNRSVPIDKEKSITPHSTKTTPHNTNNDRSDKEKNDTLHSTNNNRSVPVDKEKSTTPLSTYKNELVPPVKDPIQPNHTPKISNGQRNLLRKAVSTPVHNLGTPGGSLRDRIKRKLQENASVKLAQSPGLVQEQRREGVILQANSEAEELKKSGTDRDIGPFYGLPSKVQHLLQDLRGIQTLYDWQDECLKLPAVTEGNNLIYSLPTSGGKTLVAEILIMRELLCKKKDAMLILPFVSIVQEKVRGMSQLSVELDFLVEEYAGSKGRFPPIKRRNKNSLYIATIEKSHSLVNSLIENGRLDELGLVVVDELHMIGEGGSRGSTLESTLLKVIYSQMKIQIIGMSATLSNVSDLQTFLHADIYTSNFRPVELTEYVKIQDNIYEVQTQAKCPEDQLMHDRIVPFTYTADMTKTDPDHLLGLVMEVIPSHSCLVFCPTKKNCENVATMLCKLMVKHHREICNIKKAEKKALLRELYNDGVGQVCPTLKYTVHFGIAYHHSGLTTDERKLIEDAYSDGTLCLLACTSTLAAGVNLPAKRVILRSPYVGSNFINRSQYKQMVGRAGRAGIDNSGESILIVKVADAEKVSELLSGPMEVCHSSLLHSEGQGIRSLILSSIGLKLTPKTTDVFAFLNKTLLQVQSNTSAFGDSTEVTQRSLQQLIDLELIVQKRSLSQDEQSPIHHLEVTELGRATFKGSIKLDYAGQLYRDLQMAKESLVLASHLHLLYLVTPYDMMDMVRPVWITYFQEFNTLNPAEIKVATLIGVPESYIAKKVSGHRTKQVVDDKIVTRFYLTLMLYGLWKQKSVWEVADRFQQPRGFIQNLLSSAASFASCVFHFCQELDEFWAFQDLMGNFVKRLSYCVTAELIPLMEIPGVKLGRAKQLYSCGYHTVSQVAHADPDDIVKLIKFIPRKVAKQVVMSAKMILNEKAEALLQEVEELVAVPGGQTIHPVSPWLSSQGSLTSVASSDLLVNTQDFEEELM